MKIDVSSLPGSAPINTAGKSVRVEKASPSPSSSVSISDISSKIQALEVEARQSAGFDEARVAAIKEAMRDGKYQVNSKLIAEKLLTLASELISQQGS
jgi:negative regulator of flagellin synthesis FlgM